MMAGLALMSAGCTSSRIRIESDPGQAQVSWVRSGGVVQNLGKTPMEVDKSMVGDLFSRPVLLQIQKDGYLSDTIFVPVSHVGVRADVTTKLSQTSLPLGCSDAEQALDEVSSGVAEIQNLIWKKDYDLAMRQGNALLGKFPKVATLYGLMGNLYYLKRDTASALDFYKKAKTLNPSNRETIKMIEKLQTIRGGLGGEKAIFETPSEGGN
jgi:tetratricopeptide (TPR) repeat protein